MNWKLIFQLSVFGLIMAFATISLIPEKFEFCFWLVIFLFSAYIIAKVCTGKYFLYGLLVGLINCIWVSAGHVFFHTSYIANHPQMAAMYSAAPAPLSIHQRFSILIIGSFYGVLS